MPDRYPDYPHHTHIFEWLRDYADASRCASGSASTRACSAPSAGRTVAGRSRSEDGAQHSFDALLVCNGHHWDPRFPDFPGSFDGPQIHSHDYIDPSTRSTFTASACSSWGSATAPWTSSPSWPEDGVRHGLPLDPLGRLRRAKYLFGRPADQVVKTNPRLPGGLQRRIGRVLPRIFSGRMEDFGLPTPNHNFLDAHPTVSSELLGRLGSGDAVAKGDVAELLGDRVRFADGTVEPIDAIIYATGYKISFPFFDPEFLSAPENVLPLYKRMLKPGIDDLAFIGLGQPIPTIFPFSEIQSKLAARGCRRLGAAGHREMEAEIRRDERRSSATSRQARATRCSSTLRLRVRPAQADHPGGPGEGPVISNRSAGGRHRGVRGLTPQCLRA